MHINGRWILGGLLLVCFAVASKGHAQVAAPAAPVKAAVPVILDEPKTVDPATLMPEQLAAKVTVDFSASSLSELVSWLREKRQMVVLLNRSALGEIGMLPSEPISDQLHDEPLYLLLDRLRSLGLAWYFENKVLYITSKDDALNHMSTVPYNIGDLLDAGYKLDDLEGTITSGLSECDAEGLAFIGDVIFVRESDAVHRRVQGLLSALRKHGRQTFIFDPPQHLLIRQRLQENVSAEFVDVPLETAIKQLAKDARIDIRLDLPALREARIREREPITVHLADRPLHTVLQAMLMDFKLSWMVRDGVLWVTSSEVAEHLLNTAVYDVRDLCRDASESAALSATIMNQTHAALWAEVGGAGSIVFAKPGTMVVHNQEQTLMAVLNLLETYRTALRASKPRDRKPVDPNEVITIYYRMPAEIARDLPDLLHSLVRPDSWMGVKNANARGQIWMVASVPEWTAASSLVEDGSELETDQVIKVPQSVLVITQTRAAHEEIAKIIQRVEMGDGFEKAAISVMPATDGGLGGGGFGGGFFSVPAAKGTPSW